MITSLSLPGGGGGPPLCIIKNAVPGGLPIRSSGCGLDFALSNVYISIYVYVCSEDFFGGKRKKGFSGRPRVNFGEWGLVGRCDKHFFVAVWTVPEIR